MSFSNLELLTVSLIAIFFVLSSAELLKSSKMTHFFKIWNYDLIKIDLVKAVPLPEGWLYFLFSNQSFIWILRFQLVLAGLLIVVQDPWIVGALFILHLLVCIRFRGTFNGGSDMMVFVLLSGALILTGFQNEAQAKFGFLYIAIHSMYSYFKAGLSKILQRDWTSGQAVSAFLSRSLYPDIRKLSDWLRGQKTLSWISCWFVILFELTFILIPIFPKIVTLYFALALAFHLTVFLTFGLNRFFWAWLAAWPAIFYSVTTVRF